jgi:hypothetical protein
MFIWDPTSDQQKGPTLKILQTESSLMKYELRSLDIGNYDMGGFHNSKIILGWPPLGENIMVSKQVEQGRIEPLGC